MLLDKTKEYYIPVKNAEESIRVQIFLRKKGIWWPLSKEPCYRKENALIVRHGCIYMLHPDYSIKKYPDLHCITLSQLLGNDLEFFKRGNK